jgi:SAM-dependent methyltransferase
MKNLQDVNVQHWNEMGRQYSKAWQKPAKQLLSKQEMDFVKKYLKLFQPDTVVDLGVGNGRVMTAILESAKKDTRIYGYDISSEMIEYTRHLFADRSSDVTLEVKDILKEDLKVEPQLVTAIRVLKYNKDWRKMIDIVYQKLKPGGVFIFSMPNRHSLNYFSRYSIDFYQSTPSELRGILNNMGFEMLEMRTFTRIPDVCYELSESKNYATSLIGIERLMEKIFGSTTFGRMQFIAVRKRGK